MNKYQMAGGAAWLGGSREAGSLGWSRVSTMGARRNEDAETGVKGLCAHTPQVRQGQASFSRGQCSACPQVPACSEKVSAMVKSVRETR